MSGEPTGVFKNGFTECSLWVEFRVALIDQDGWCPLTALDLPVRVVRQHVRDDTCIVHVDVSGDSETTTIAQMSVDCDRRCACNVMTDRGHIPHLKEVGEDGIVIGTHLSDRSEIGELVTDLEEISTRVSLRRLSRQGTDCDADPITIDLSSLTEKQQEAATLAVSKGYYEQPRETTVDQLAEELDISKSAVSQRLSAVESKLATAAFNDCASS
jgi:predicted DNA binding protein